MTIFMTSRMNDSKVMEFSLKLRVDQDFNSCIYLYILYIFMYIIFTEERKWKNAKIQYIQVSITMKKRLTKNYRKLRRKRGTNES